MEQPGPRARPIPHQTNGPGPVPRLGMGPETSRAPKEGKLHVDSRGLGPPIGVRDLPRPSGTSRVHPGPSCASLPARGLAHPPHSMGVVEACSVAAARGAAFARPHCRPHITEVHSAAASAQSPSAALNGYDGMALFHHAAYAASYTARSATLQATPQATPCRRFDKTAWICWTGDSHGQSKEIQE